MKRWLLYALIGLFAITFCVSGYFLLTYRQESVKNEQLYEDLSQIVAEIRATIPTAGTVADDGPAEPTAGTDVPTEPTEPTILPEYLPIYELNQDLVGWIQIEGTKINYPVLQSRDYKNYYIAHNFEGEASKHGAIYAQETCDVFTPSDNVVLYGHRMNDGSMFADLLKYKDKSYYESHKYIRFDTLYERNTYEVIAVFQIKSVQNNTFQYHQFVDFEYESQFNTFMTRVDLLKLYNPGTTAYFGDQLLTLSTCEKNYSNGRFVVIAKKIDNG